MKILRNRLSSFCPYSNTIFAFMLLRERHADMKYKIPEAHNIHRSTILLYCSEMGKSGASTTQCTSKYLNHTCYRLRSSLVTDESRQFAVALRKDRTLTTSSVRIQKKILKFFVLVGTVM